MKDKYEQLCKKYPKIFKTNCITCGEGWYDIVEQVVKLIDNLTELNKYPPIEIVQIKEKFGQIRIYYTITDESTEAQDAFISGMIESAISFSGLICENCGNRSKVYNRNGWYSTICKKCYKEAYE